MLKTTPALLHLNLALLTLIAASNAMAQTCRATAGAQPPTVVELYTSEGCSSCPPADKWLSTLKGSPNVLALAFHVTYWDRLGWPDRFASPEGTQRQHELARTFGSSQVYTPQVVVNGQDWRRWPQLPGSATTSQARPVALTLQRDGGLVTAQIAAAPAAARALAGYWAVLEDQHESRVRAGENNGETLRHDHVVRLYQPVAAWPASAAHKAALNVSPGVAAHPRRVVFVVTDAATQRPLQALALAC